MKAIKVDKQRRLNIPQDLLEIADINASSRLVICLSEENYFFLRNLENVQDCKIIAVVTMDSKGRIIIPKRISDANSYEIFVQNGDLFFVSSPD